MKKYLLALSLSMIILTACSSTTPTASPTESSTTTSPKESSTIVEEDRVQANGDIITRTIRMIDGKEIVSEEIVGKVPIIPKGIRSKNLHWHRFEYKSKNGGFVYAQGDGTVTDKKDGGNIIEPVYLGETNEDKVRTLTKSEYSSLTGNRRSAGNNQTETNKDEILELKNKVSKNTARIEEVSKESRQGTALTTAMAQINPMGTKEGKIGVGVGMGHFKGETGVAFGAGYGVSENLSISTKGAFSTSDIKTFSIGAGVNFEF